jgi:hypothetical protein
MQTLGVNVIVTIFCVFDQFSAKKILLNTCAMIPLLGIKLQYFEKKSSMYISPTFFGENISKNPNIGQNLGHPLRIVAVV